MKPKTQKREGPGKPPLSETERTVLIRAKVTTSQRDKFLRVGGSEWLRGVIDGNAGMRWVPFRQELWSDQPLPPVRKYLLLQIEAKPDGGLPPSVAVGYMRFAAGDENSPVFTIPGVGGSVSAWCDCLPHEFNAPLWPGTQRACQPI